MGQWRVRHPPHPRGPRPGGDLSLSGFVLDQRKYLNLASDHPADVWGRGGGLGPRALHQAAADVVPTRPGENLFPSGFVLNFDNICYFSQELPRAYLVDTSEEALLIPDWLKLKMIRSSVGVLVDSALKDLDPQQLVLFIQVRICSLPDLFKAFDNNSSCRASASRWSRCPSCCRPSTRR